MRMSYEEMAAFLERPLVASFVTLRADGSPEVAPVWYQFADGDFIVYTSRTFRRVRNIERDSRVVISIAPHDAPYAYVTAEGRAMITRDGVAEVARAITERATVWPRSRAPSRNGTCRGKRLRIFSTRRWTTTPSCYGSRQSASSRGSARSRGRATPS